MAVLHLTGGVLDLYSFYNHRICKEFNSIDIKFKKTFKYCQANIHGIQTPNYESLKQVDRRLVYDKIINQVDGLNKQISHNDLSCYKLRKILEQLFIHEFKGVVNIYYKGGNFEREYFKQFIDNNVNIVDLGKFDIIKYINIVRKYIVCNIKRHSMLRKSDSEWIRHCPQFEVLSFYEYSKLNL